MKFNSLLYAACILMLSLGAKADLIVSTDDYVTFQWEAVCGDCQSDKGVFSEDFKVGVTGNIVISGYTLGQAFTFDQSNIVSFQYDGPSNHIDKFVMHNANFDDEDIWEDASTIFEQIYDGRPLTLNPEALDGNGYTHFGENMTAVGSIAADFSSYTLSLMFDTYVPYGDDETYIPFSALDSDNQYPLKKEAFNINVLDSGVWGISVGGEEFDLGTGAKISLQPDGPITDVPEPSTFAIFALGLMGLASRRFKRPA
jgi:hypothetical protein